MQATLLFDTRDERRRPRAARSGAGRDVRAIGRFPRRRASRTTSEAHQVCVKPECVRTIPVRPDPNAPGPGSAAICPTRVRCLVISRRRRGVVSLRGPRPLARMEFRRRLSQRTSFRTPARTLVQASGRFPPLSVRESVRSAAFCRVQQSLTWDNTRFTQEDARLCLLVQAHGAKNWSFIAQGIPDRTSKSCRLRWCNQLNPALRHDAFSAARSASSWLRTKLGNKWSTIAKLLPGRTDAPSRITCTASSVVSPLVPIPPRWWGEQRATARAAAATVTTVMTVMTSEGKPPPGEECPRRRREGRRSRRERERCWTHREPTSRAWRRRSVSDASATGERATKKRKRRSTKKKGRSELDLRKMSSEVLEEYARAMEQKHTQSLAKMGLSTKGLMHGSRNDANSALRGAAGQGAEQGTGQGAEQGRGTRRRRRSEV